jgi:thioredoxin
MIIGEKMMAIQEGFWSWTKKFKGSFLELPTRLLFTIVNFVFFQFTNLFAQLRWPFSAVVRLIKSIFPIPDGHPIPCNESKFEKLIKENQVVLADFWTEWCGPCILMEDTIKKFAKDYVGRIKVAKVDATINPKLTKKYNVMGYPTIMLFFEGEEIGRVTGAQNYKSLVKFLNYYLTDEEQDSPS